MTYANCPIVPDNESLMEEVRESRAPVLVFFWAEWCAPCAAITSILDDLADQYKEQIKICKINIDEQPRLADDYGVRAVPTLLLVTRGQVSDRLMGVRCKRDIEESYRQARL